MIVETKEEGVVVSIMTPYLPIYGFNVSEFVSDSNNVCLLEGRDLSLFEKTSDDVYEAHYFFESRGKQALTVARQMLAYFFQTYQPQIIKGLTPLEHLGARWMSRKLGFKTYGVVQTVVGPCELFILTKEDWENRINE